MLSVSMKKNEENTGQAEKQIQHHLADAYGSLICQLLLLKKVISQDPSLMCTARHRSSYPHVSIKRRKTKASESSQTSGFFSQQ